jgi:hypothetical protein
MLDAPYTYTVAFRTASVVIQNGKLIGKLKRIAIRVLAIEAGKDDYKASTGDERLYLLGA